MRFFLLDADGTSLKLINVGICMGPNSSDYYFSTEEVARNATGMHSISPSSTEPRLPTNVSDDNS